MLEQGVACMLSEEIIAVLTHMVVLVLILLLSGVVPVWHSCAETDNAGRYSHGRAGLSPQLQHGSDTLIAVTAGQLYHGTLTAGTAGRYSHCLLYTSPSPRDS